MFTRKALSTAFKAGRFNSIRPLTAATSRVFSSDNFLSGSNANYIDAMHNQWLKDPSSVHASWQAYFSGSTY
jgi:hypothetical protein